MSIPDKPEEFDDARRVNQRMVMRAAAMEGTRTGEHGIGSGKMDYFAKEHGAATDVMRTLKRALDPADLMNPGEVLRP